MEEKHETFQYTYSAKEQEEIKRIREKYAPPVKEEKLSGPLEEMRRLDVPWCGGRTFSLQVS